MEEISQKNNHNPNVVELNVVVSFTEIYNNIYLFEDFVNVFVIKDENKAILIDFGSGKVLDFLHEIGIEKIDFIFHTHYHCDQCFGDYRAIERGIPIAAPYKERKLFTDAVNFWKTKSYYHIYYFKPTFFVSTYNIPLTKSFKDGETFKWGFHHFKAIETSGHTTGSMTYLLRYNDKVVAFTGDLIHSGGKILTYYDLEYQYGIDMGDIGMKKSLKSFKKLLKQKPDTLLPSHGEIILNHQKEIEVLKKRFKQVNSALRLGKVGLARFMAKLFMSRQFTLNLLLKKDSTKKDIKALFSHIIRDGFGTSVILVGSNQNCLLMDFPGDNSSFFYDEKRLFDILDKNNIKTIDFIIPTHYHDDHIAGIPFLQQKYNIKVFALENMVDILENPIHYRMPCMMDQSIKVDRTLKDGEVLKWDKYEFKIYHFPGQTEYHMGMFGIVDGKRVFFAGDSFKDNILNEQDTNIICHNLCEIGENAGSLKCAEILLGCNPEYIITSHIGILKVDKQLLHDYRNAVSKYRTVLSDIIAQEDPNMGYNPHWLNFNPIRVITRVGEEFQTNLSIKNYVNKLSSVDFELNLPKGWTADMIKGSSTIEKNETKKIPINIKIPEDADPNGRTIITANITWNGKALGPLPDLMIDHGYNPSEKWSGWTSKKGPTLFQWLLKSKERDLQFLK